MCEYLNPHSREKIYGTISAQAMCDKDTSSLTSGRSEFVTVESMHKTTAIAWCNHAPKECYCDSKSDALVLVEKYGSRYLFDYDIHEIRPGCVCVFYNPEKDSRVSGTVQAIAYCG